MRHVVNSISQNMNCGYMLLYNDHVKNNRLERKRKLKKIVTLHHVGQKVTLSIL